VRRVPSLTQPIDWVSNIAIPCHCASTARTRQLAPRSKTATGNGRPWVHYSLYPAPAPFWSNRTACKIAGRVPTQRPPMRQKLETGRDRAARGNCDPLNGATLRSTVLKGWGPRRGCGRGRLPRTSATKPRIAHGAYLGLGEPTPCPNGSGSPHASSPTYSIAWPEAAWNVLTPDEMPTPRRQPRTKCWSGCSIGVTPLT